MDERATAIQAWVASRLNSGEIDMQPASGDASFRRYFRISSGADTWIAMDAPPDKEDCKPFMRVAGLLRRAGLHAPEVVEADLEQGFLLLTDLGRQTYLDVLGDENADALFADAVTALVQMQAAIKTGDLPLYNKELLQGELDWYPDWYLARHLGTAFSKTETEVWRETCAALIDNAVSQPQVFVHRDYMPRNLMISEPNPGIIDFQDAVLGPVTYDLLSLFRDAFISWDEKRVMEWVRRYWHAAQEARLSLPGDYQDFVRDFDWMGVQRHLKVIGIFSRLNYRDGKSGYLAEIPRFVEYIRLVGAKYSAFSGLLRVFDRVESAVANQ